MHRMDEPRGQQKLLVKYVSVISFKSFDKCVLPQTTSLVILSQNKITKRGNYLIKFINAPTFTTGAGHVLATINFPPPNRGVL